MVLDFRMKLLFIIFLEESNKQNILGFSVQLDFVFLVRSTFHIFR